MAEYARKGNRIYEVIGAKERKDYLAQGFDIIDEDGDVVENSPIKQIPYATYSELLTEYEGALLRIGELEAEAEKLKKAVKASGKNNKPPEISDEKQDEKPPEAQ